MVAYLQSIAQKEMTNKEVFVDACQRCHGLKNMLICKKGTMGAFSPDADITKYMGKTPPDLSQYIISRGPDYLGKFINEKKTT